MDKKYGLSAYGVGIKRFLQITITGKLPHRDASVYGKMGGGNKAKCVTTNSNTAGIGQAHANEFILEYLE